MTGERVRDVGVARTAPLSPSSILEICDRTVKEIGRRRHLFAWLRKPGGGNEDWLIVDAYYPGNRLVVICREEQGEHDGVYAELVPKHGLRLLQLTPAELPTDPTSAMRELADRIAALGDSPQRTTGFMPGNGDRPSARRSRREDGEPRESPVARAAAALVRPIPPPAPTPRRVGTSQAAAAERAARFVQAKKSSPARPQSARPQPARPQPARPQSARPQPARPNAPIRRAPRPPVRARPSPDGNPTTLRPRPSARGSAPGPDPDALGIALGIVLAVALLTEMYLAVARVALDGGRPVLAAGIALDACARTLGTIAAARTGRQDWAWGCVLGGSPAVAGFALFRSDGPVLTEPAPLAGLLALLAGLVIAVGLLAAVLGV